MLHSLRACHALCRQDRLQLRALGLALSVGVSAR